MLLLTNALVGRFVFAVTLLALALASVGARGSLAAETVDYNRDIKPLLSNSCYACHGPDSHDRQADLRLDVREFAVEHSGVIVPGRPDDSEVMARLITDDADLKMPPADSHRPVLTPEQVELIRRWIAEGANFQEHWAFAKLTRPALPAVKNQDWVRNPIDAFVAWRLESKGAMPAPEADRRTLIRRLSFDVAGLPPKPEAVDAFLADQSPDAYERLVERLLADPHYGERMAQYWLDLVRYADSIGYHSDNPREVSMYRDYVIRAFNDNMPFDRFTIEQIAGDLLPDAGWEQQVASGYNLLLQTTEEGGAQPKEYAAKYSADRVRNVADVWLGVSMGCAECHNHKYDPFTTKDFYSLAAFFADIQEPAVGRRPQTPVLTPEFAARQKEFEAAVAEAQSRLDAPSPELDAAQAEWQAAMRVQGFVAPQLGTWHSIGPFTAGSFDEAHDKAFEPEQEIELKKTYANGRLKWQPQPDWKDGQPRELSGENAATYLFRTITVGEAMSLPVSLGSDDGIKVWVNGTLVLNNKIQRGLAPDQEQLTLDLKPGENKLLVKIVNAAGGAGFYFAVAQSGLPAEIVKILRTPDDQLDAAQKAALGKHFRSVAPQLEEARQQLAARQRELEEFKKTIPVSLVTKSGSPRTIRILPRGNWLDDSGPVVEPALPEYLGKLNTEGRPTRLDLARWLTAPENPLVARTMVNRLWQLFFGAGLSRTVEDMGVQGDPPTHPELLDWLASEYIDSGWDTKHIVRLILGSSTYRQDSRPGGDLRQRDPENRWLARQGRFRLDAEMVRDSALAISGLLVDQVGGPSVKPYQPAGYWMHLNFPQREWENDAGEKLYRRGLYTHWQRTFLHPSLLAFDAPSREECTARRPRSNTPQQALALLNDPTYVEAARAFAERILSEGGEDAEQRLDFAFRQTLSRMPTEQERQLLLDLRNQHLETYRGDAAAAERLLSIGAWPRSSDLDAAELASWTSVARVLLNLPESIFRY
ncbi:MAG: DUF1553 domain-containing protein [Pirellulaceae bacterium]|nr:DUF1553 domain-containing protein [Pirellulaceae bacterium]